MSAPEQGGWPSPAQNQATGELFPLVLPTRLMRPEWLQLNRRRRRAGLRDLQTTVLALNWMHGELSSSAQPVYIGAESRAS